MFVLAGPYLTQGKYDGAIFLPNTACNDDNFITLGRQTDNCLDDINLCPNGMTLSFWFMPVQQNYKWPQILSSATSNIYMKKTHGNLQLRAHFTNDTHRAYFIDDTPMMTEAIWHLLAITHSQGKFKFYYDGCEVNPTKIVPEPQDVRDFTLGCKPEGTHCPRGHYDDFRFWKTAKSPRFIYWLWQN